MVPLVPRIILKILSIFFATIAAKNHIFSYISFWFLIFSNAWHEIREHNNKLCIDFKFVLNFLLITWSLNHRMENRIERQVWITGKHSDINIIEFHYSSNICVIFAKSLIELQMSETFECLFATKAIISLIFD